MKLATLAYLPPKGFPGVQVFFDNLSRFKRGQDLLLYSNGEWGSGVVPLKGNPEVARNLRPQNKFAVNNLVFFTGLRIAHRQGYTHVIYLEVDCRVGCDRWDERIFAEYFNLGRPCIAAGTLACYNPCNTSRLAAKRWEQLVSRNVKRNMPVATYGWSPAGKVEPTCVFPNGALSVLDIGAMSQVFDLEQTQTEALKDVPWDMAIGMRLWQTFKEETYDVVGFLTSIYSGFGDILTTEEERLNMLRADEVVAVHQVKSEATI